MRTLRAHAAVLKLLAARKALEQERYRGTERRQQLRDERRLELSFRMGAALTLSLGAGTGLQLEDTRHRLGGARWSASLHHPLVSLSTTRELCAVAGAQDVVPCAPISRSLKCCYIMSIP